MIEKIYDYLYAAADDIIKRDNPCQIVNDNGKVSCVRSRKDPSFENGLCCQGCQHLGPNGCTVQSLTCKLFACTTSPDSWERAGWSAQTWEDLSYLRRAAVKSEIPLYFRADKNTTFLRRLI